MSATAFQRQRRLLQEQTSVAARMNEDGPGDPYAKTTANYDQQEVQDQGELHQAGDPPPYSLTPHTPERLHDPTAEEDEGTIHQQGDPPPSSVELRRDESDDIAGVEGDQFEDQKKYDALDKREAPYTTFSEPNVDLYPGGVYDARGVRAEGGSGPVYSVPPDPDEANASEANERVDDLESRKVPELRETAKSEGVEGYSDMKKAELIAAIRENRSGGASVPADPEGYSAEDQVEGSRVDYGGE